MLSKVELYIKDIIENKRKGVIPFFIKGFLLFLSFLYRYAVRCRNWCYDKGWMKQYVSPVPLVISVGNIVAGGTGKTPITLLLAKAFYERFPIAILSRGYRSAAEKLESPIMLSEGNGPLYPALYCGDEPYIFAQRLPKAMVIVGGNRQKASCLAAKAGAQIILLDDGMQHRSLARDFDVVVVDVNDPFGRNHFLPRGFLREDKKSLSRASLVILNRIANSEQFENIKKEISKYAAVPVIGTNWRIQSIQNLEEKKIESIRGLKIGMFCGIASPDCFRATLEQEGAIIVNEYCVPDHQAVQEEKLKTFAQISIAKGAQLLICTEKDRVKLDHQLVIKPEIAWLSMEMQVVEGQQEWETFLSKAEMKIY